MATIKYCDFINGDDTNGDGSAGSPYKTITKASTGLTGGDEVRVAKSPDPTNLTGTLAFTNNSTAVVGTNTLFTSELAIGDFVKGGDGYWWEAVIITDDTHLTLYKVYAGSTASGVSSQKLGITDTGEATESSTIIQEVSASGTASANLKVSGGWDLSSETQTGQTFFRQMHSTFANRYGYGLYINKDYIEVSSRLNFLRYNIGIYVSTYHKNITIDSAICCSNTTGIDINRSTDCNIISAVCNANNNYGIYAHAYSYNSNIINSNCNSNGYSGIWVYNFCYNSTVDSPTCNYNGVNGIQTDSNNTKILSPICNYNAENGIYIVSHNNLIKSPTCNSNSKYGISITNYNNNIVLGTLTTFGNTLGSINNELGVNYVQKANISEVTKVAGLTNFANSRLFINDIGGNSEIWTDDANAIRQDATAGGTGKEWKLSITGSNRGTHYPFSVAIAAVPVNANKQVTVKLYFKKSGTGIAGRLFVRGGQIAGVDSDIYTECPDDTNRNQVTLQFTPTESGVVEIEAQAWYVSSTTQYIIVDDIDIMQAD